MKEFPNNCYIVNKGTICNVHNKEENISDQVKKGASIVMPESVLITLIMM